MAVVLAIVLACQCPALGAGEPEQAARQFAAEHHPELAALLDQLERTAPAEFADAIRELDAARRHLESLRIRDNDEYDLGLRDWKLMSRIRLRLARMAPGDDPASDEELRSMVKERLELRAQALRAEREFVMRRFDRITGELVEYERSPAEAADRELGKLQMSLRNAPARTESPKK